MEKPASQLRAVDAESPATEEHVEERVESAVSHRHQLADRQSGVDANGVVRVDAYEADDEVRRPAGDEPDDDGHGHLDDVPLGRDDRLHPRRNGLLHPRRRGRLLLVRPRMEKSVVVVVVVGGTTTTPGTVIRGPVRPYTVRYHVTGGAKTVGHRVCRLLSRRDEVDLRPASAAGGPARTDCTARARCPVVF